MEEVQGWGKSPAFPIFPAQLRWTGSEVHCSFAKWWLSGSFKTTGCSWVTVTQPLEAGVIWLKKKKKANKSTSFLRASVRACLSPSPGQSSCVSALQPANPHTFGGTRRERKAEGRGSSTRFGFSNWRQRQEDSVQIQLFASCVPQPSFPCAKRKRGGSRCRPRSPPQKPHQENPESGFSYAFIARTKGTWSSPEHLRFCGVSVRFSHREPSPRNPKVAPCSCGCASKGRDRARGPGAEQVREGAAGQRNEKKKCEEFWRYELRAPVWLQAEPAPVPGARLAPGGRGEAAARLPGAGRGDTRPGHPARRIHPGLATPFCVCSHPCGWQSRTSFHQRNCNL